MNVRQLLPSYDKSSEPQSANVSSLEELLDLPWIKLVGKDAKIYRFSSGYTGNDWILMTELRGTQEVLALLSGDDVLGIIKTLPVFPVSKSPLK
jgi:hypothetical protein